MNFYKDLVVVNKGKERLQRQIQEKEFQPIEFVDLMPPPYVEDSTSDEDFIAETKVIWTVKKRKKWSKVEEANKVLIKDLIINDNEYVPERQPKKVEDWTQQLMKEVFQEQDHK